MQVDQDVDFLIILSLLPEQYENVYLLKPSVGKATAKLYDRNCFNIPQQQKYLGFFMHLMATILHLHFSKLVKKDL